MLEKPCAPQSGPTDIRDLTAHERPLRPELRPRSNLHSGSDTTPSTDNDNLWVLNLGLGGDCQEARMKPGAGMGLSGERYQAMVQNLLRAESFRLQVRGRA